MALVSEAPRVGQFIRIRHIGVECTVLPRFGQLDRDRPEERRGVPRRLPIEPKGVEAQSAVRRIIHTSVHLTPPRRCSMGQPESQHWQA